jgi:hypothetical protein
VHARLWQGRILVLHGSSVCKEASVKGDILRPASSIKGYAIMICRVVRLETCPVELILQAEPCKVQ